MLTDRKLIFSSFTMDTADGDGDHEAGCGGDEDDDFCNARMVWNPHCGWC